MITAPEKMNFSNKKFSMIVYGSPGLGKTTLALSAPKPILVDFDKGISRVKAQHRKPTSICATYEEVLADITAENLKDFETVILDTGGAFITYLQDWAMRTNPAVNRQKNGALSLKGFGTVKAEFQRFTNFVRTTLDKNIIYVFHSEEQKDKDGNPQQRLLCEGATRNLVWQPCDLGGYIQMIGDKRYICFTPQAEFFAKGCYGIEGMREIPTLAPTDKNDFLTRLFDEARTNIANEMEAFAPEKEQYETVMSIVNELIDGITTAEEATEAATAIPKLEHALTSKKEASALLNAKAKALGFKWDKTAKAYVSEKTENPTETPEEKAADNG